VAAVVPTRKTRSSKPHAGASVGRTFTPEKTHRLYRQVMLDRVHDLRLSAGRIACSAQRRRWAKSSPPGWTPEGRIGILIGLEGFGGGRCGANPGKGRNNGRRFCGERGCARCPGRTSKGRAWNQLPPTPRSPGKRLRVSDAIHGRRAGTNSHRFRGQYELIGGAPRRFKGMSSCANGRTTALPPIQIDGNQTRLLSGKDAQAF